MSSRRRLLRSTVAILAGFIVVVVLSTATDIAMHASGVYPAMGQGMSDSLWLLATAYRVLYAIAGGYLTARLAPDRPVAHAIVLGTIGIVMCTLGVVLTWDKGPDFGPKWYGLGLYLTTIPCTWLGAILFAKSRIVKT
ncbi:MAG: hypothetical protein ABI411_12680 [Tahibacter sp.]